MKFLLLFLVATLLLSCGGPNGTRKTASADGVSEEQPPTEQGEVWSAKEMHSARLIREQFRNALNASTPEGEEMKRDAHPKHHGCVKAKLTIDNTKLKDEYKVGLYENNSSYNALIRFSNGDPNHKKADAKSDVRGMAVKLFDVPYTSYLEETGVDENLKVHDFVFMNSPEFFIKDPKHYGKFMDSVESGGLGVAFFAVGAFFNPKDKFITILRKAFGMKVGNPLDIDYHSATPYKLGPTSSKMKFVSCKSNKEKVPKHAPDNFLRNRLAHYLDKQGTCFDFYLQPNNDKKKNDIENAQQKWKTRKSPFIKVGRLEVPQQSKKEIVAREQACQDMSFNPWRAPNENRPMGGVNRIRLEVYVKQAKMRQNYNDVEYPGPSEFK